MSLTCPCKSVLRSIRAHVSANTDPEDIKKGKIIHLSVICECTVLCLWLLNRGWGLPEEEKESGLHWWKRQAKCCSTRSLSWVSPISTTTFRKDLQSLTAKINNWIDKNSILMSERVMAVILTSGHDPEFARGSRRISDIPPRQHDWSHY